jgi:uncharacterized protein (TIGR02300 family)
MDRGANWEKATKLLTGAATHGKRRPSQAFQLAGERHLAKAELGDKQVCPNCSAKFYDLGRRPATCPKCATSFDPAEEGVRLKRARTKTPASYDDDEESEEAEGKAKAAAGEEDEEETEVTPEIDAEGEADPIVTDDDDDGEPTGDELPPGFSEEEADLADAGDEDVPMLDDEEEFPEDEIGELPDADDDDGR